MKKENKLPHTATEHFWWKSENMGYRGAYFPLPNLEDRAFSVLAIFFLIFALLSSSYQMVRGEQNGGVEEGVKSLEVQDTHVNLCI